MTAVMVELYLHSFLYRLFGIVPFNPLLPTGMRILFSKTDSLGDQLLGSALIAALLEAKPIKGVIWLVHSGYEPIATLLNGCRILRPDISRPPKEEASRCLTMLATPGKALWSPVVIVPVPFDAYRPMQRDQDSIPGFSWWGAWVCALQVDVAIVGTIEYNWVDRAMVLASHAKSRLVFEPLHKTCQLHPSIETELHALNAPLTFSHKINQAINIDDELENLASLGRLLVPKLKCLEIQIAPLPPKKFNSVPQPTTRFECVLAPGAGHANRTYPPKKWVKVLQSLPRFLESRLVHLRLLDGPADHAIVLETSKELNHHDIAHNIVHVPRADLPALARILSHADLLLCNDTFIAHLAAVIGIPAVGVWGMHHGGQRFFPKKGNLGIVYSDVPCKGCDGSCLFKNRLCITAVPEHALIDAVQRIIKIDRSLNKPLLFKQPSTVTSAKLVHTLRHFEAKSREEKSQALLIRSQLTQTIQEQTAYIASLEKERNANARLAADLQPKLKAAYRTIDEQKNYLTALEQQRDHAAEESTRTARESTKLMQTLREQTSYLASLEKERNEGARLAADLQSKLEAAYRTIDEQKNYLASLEQQRDHAVKESARLSTELARQASILQEQSAYIASLKKDQEQLYSRETQLASENARYLKTIEEQTSYIKTLESARENPPLAPPNPN